jgi:(1->4)-alpha-D-glucan 1-alpha-D-glucosylmutase
MRIAAITREPEAFEAWFRICRGFAPPRLNPNLVWYIAQTFLALQPDDGDMGERLADHVVKALREAKSESFWTAPDLELEAAAQAFCHRLASHFPRHAPEVADIVEAAGRLTLVQTALKLTIPGIPDIYQGCELPFHALTDPDNRRAVDFDLRRQAVADAGVLEEGLARSKFEMTRRLLWLRREEAELFLHGGYERLEAPPRVCAFARTMPGRRLAVAVHSDEGDARSLDDVLPHGERIWPAGDNDDGPVRIVLAAEGRG